MFQVEEIAFTRARELGGIAARCLHGAVSCSAWMDHRIHQGLRKNEGDETQGQIMKAS